MGLAAETMRWDRDSNWTPMGAPTSEDTVYIAATNPYVAITGRNCLAHTVVIQDGGRLVLRKEDIGNSLTIARDFIVEAGGIFNTDGTPGGIGPLVYIAGNVINDGIWDLSWVSSNGQNRGVIFNGVGTQTISGSSPLTFHNLTNDPNDSLIIIGTRVGVVGKLTPQTGAMVFGIDGGSIVVGVRPLTVVLESFTVVRDTDMAAMVVLLRWVTSTEYSNHGFCIERRTSGATIFDSIAFQPSLGSGVQQLIYGAMDTTVTAGWWDYRLRAVDTLGNQILFAPASIFLAPATDVAGPGEQPTFRLEQNYPNPYNPDTRITFRVATSGRAMLKVYNSIGQEIAVLFDGEVRSGVSYTATFHAPQLPSGVYFYRLEEGARSETRRMILLR